MIKNTNEVLAALCTISGATGKVSKSGDRSIIMLELQTANGGIELTLDQLNSIYSGIVRCWPMITPLKDQLAGLRKQELVAERAQVKAGKKAERDAKKTAEKLARDEAKEEANKLKEEAKAEAKAARDKIMADAKARAEKAIQDLKNSKPPVSSKELKKGKAKG